MWNPIDRLGSLLDELEEITQSYRDLMEESNHLVAELEPVVSRERVGDRYLEDLEGNFNDN